jgi:ABC-2 type transport system permease protein
MTSEQKPAENPKNSSSSPVLESKIIATGWPPLILLEFRKLLAYRSVHLGLMAVFAMPFLLSFAPDSQLGNLVGSNIILTSGWQVAGLSLYIIMQLVLPLLVSVTCAEVVGGEVAWGTLSPMLLRPVSRARIILTKLLVVILYPFILLATTFIGSMIAGLRFGLGGFAGGTGLGDGGFAGVGLLDSGAALIEVVRGYSVAGLALAPIAALAVFFAVRFLNTAAAALATIATITLMRLLVIFPFVTPFLLTTHLNAFIPGQNAPNSLMLLFLYTAGLCIVTLAIFERKDF